MPETPAFGCCLFLMGEGTASSGWCSPDAYSLKPQGDDVAEHHLMHLHEIHHKVLNDDTAWGAFIHIAARHPGWGADLLPGLIKACRTVHEAFATFMSLSMARTRHEDAQLVLRRYPAYERFAARFSKLLDPIRGVHRRDLAATGIARWCMSAPILNMALDAYPRPVSLAEIPAVMRPDHRFHLASGMSGNQIAAAGERADDAFRRSVGRDVEDLGLAETDAMLDDAWGVWEDTFVAALMEAEPKVAALPTLPRDGHLEMAAALTRAASLPRVSVELPHEHREIPSDVETTQRLLTAAVLVLRDTPQAAALATLGQEALTSEILALCRANHPPHVVLQGRRAADLARSFRFGDGERALLARWGNKPVFVIRNRIDYDGEDVILNSIVPTPESFTAAAAEWAGCGTSVVCMTASCYLDVAWQCAWLPALAAWPVVVLVDMGLSGMLGAGRLLGDAEAVHGAYVGLGPGALKALAWHVEGHPHVMLAVGDDLTVQFIAGQLKDLLGARLHLRDSDWTQWIDALTAVTSNLLATEHVLRYDGGSPTTRERDGAA